MIICSGVQSIEHPNVLREKKIISLHMGLQIDQFFLCGTLTQYIFRFDKFFDPSDPTYMVICDQNVSNFVILANPKLKVLRK